MTAACGLVLLVSVQRDRTHEPHAWLLSIYSYKKIAHLEMKLTALVAASDSSNGVSAGPTTGMLLTRLNSEGIKLPNRLRIPKSSTCHRLPEPSEPPSRQRECVRAVVKMRGRRTRTPRRAEPRRTRKTPKRKMPEPRARSRCARNAYAR